MDTRLRFILILCMLYEVYPNPVPNQDTREKRNSEKITDLRSKVSRLQDILEQIQKEEPGSEPVKKDVKSSINPDVKITEHERENMHTESEMGTAKKTQSPKLTPDESELLQALKLTLEKERESRHQNDLDRLKSQKSEHKDTSNEKTNTEMSDTHMFLDQQQNEKDNRNSEIEEELKSYAQPKEGRFGSFQNDRKVQTYIDKTKEERYKLFRQRVLRALEQRLLEDINTALSHGFSLEEILQDLQRADDEANIAEMEAIEKKLSELRKYRD